MCYAKPGPRCSYHVQQQIEKAKTNKDTEKLRQLLEEYRTTPAGIQELKKIDPEQAKEASRQRKQQLTAYKQLHDFKPVKVYRQGSLEPSSYEGEVKEYADKADAVCPVGRAKRSGSLYASPSLKGVTRWVRGNLMNMRVKEPETYELTLNPETVYVYDIEKWEAYSWHGHDPQEYWDSGILLKDYLANQEQFDDANWEILFTEDDILDASRVSKQRLINQVEDEYYKDELAHLLKRFQVK